MNAIGIKTLLITCLLSQNLVMAAVHVRPIPEAEIPFHIHSDGRIHFEHKADHDSDDSDDRTKEHVLVVAAPFACILSSNFHAESRPLLMQRVHLDVVFPQSLNSTQAVNPIFRTDCKIYRKNCALIL